VNCSGFPRQLEPHSRLSISISRHPTSIWEKLQDNGILLGASPFPRRGPYGERALSLQAVPD
jgi:hypothetical protein